MKKNYRKLGILLSIDILADKYNPSFSRTKDIKRLIGGYHTLNSTSKALSHYLNWGYIKIKRGKNYDKNVKRQRQVCYDLTDKGERILERLESRYNNGKDLNLKNGHIPHDCCFVDEGVLLEGYKEMKEEGLI